MGLGEEGGWPTFSSAASPSKNLTFFEDSPFLVVAVPFLGFPFLSFLSYPVITTRNPIKCPTYLYFLGYGMSPSRRSQSPGFPVRVSLHRKCPAHSKLVETSVVLLQLISSSISRTTRALCHVLLQVFRGFVTIAFLRNHLNECATNDRRLVAVVVVRKVSTRF